MITNQSRQVQLARRCSIAQGFFGKLKGLMFSSLGPGEGFVMWFSSMSARGIHTCFVKAPIDILYLDEDWKIVEIVKALEPYSFYQPKQKSQFIVELPADTLTKGNCRIGDVISIVQGRDEIVQA